MENTGKNEKMLVTSFFSFSHSVFYPIKERNYHFNPFPHKPWFLRVCRSTLLKTLWEFLFFPMVFSSHLENFLPFSSNLKLTSANSFNLEGSKICCLGKGYLHLFCHLQCFQFGLCQNFVWKRVNSFTTE